VATGSSTAVALPPTVFLAAEPVATVHLPMALPRARAQ
jgi:hypothetical protein